MRRRTIKKNFWLSYEEDRQLKFLSASLNLSEVDTIRKLLVETYVKASPPKEFYDYLNKLNMIGVNINQIAKIANSTNYVYARELTKNVKELNSMIEFIKEKYG